MPLRELPQRADGAGPVRIAVVVPWVRRADRMSDCAAHSKTYEVSVMKAPCEAFSSLPPSWHFWIASAAANADVADFLITHDGDTQDPTIFHRAAGLAEMPPNIKVVKFANLTQLYRRRLGVAELLPTIEKVKDFKPMIGKVYERQLAGYSHWAFGDVDVVYGSLRRFLTPDILSHDIVTFRANDLCFTTKTAFAGQLTVLANNEWTRNLYANVSGWRSVALNPKFLFFDERVLPRWVLRNAAGRTAFVVAQLTERNTHRVPRPPPAFRPGGAQSRHLVWVASQGRLLAVQRRPAALATAASSWCVESEVALVHLNLNKFLFFRGAPFSNEPLGFVHEPARGILPLSKEPATADPAVLNARAAVGEVERGVAGPCAERWPDREGVIDSHVPPPQPNASSAAGAPSARRRRGHGRG